jgi:hypothetical protein
MAIHNILIHPWILDDAFISFRYAENFASGHGIVYNIGERVEGYTSFLWVVLLALGKTIGFDLIAFSKFLGIGFGVGSLVLLVNAHRFIKNLDSQISSIATLFLGTCGIFTPWATSGMEITLFVFLTLLSILLYISNRQTVRNKSRWFLLGIVCATSALTRPEGVLFFGVMFIDQLVLNIKLKSKTVIYLTVSFLAIYLPYFIWRYWYYGYMLPNTFYGKVGSSIYQVERGGKYLLQFAIPAAFLLIPMVISIFSLGWFKKSRSLYLLPLLVLIYTLYVVLVGGDCMPAFRFFTPILAILCLLSAMSITLLIRNKKFLLAMIILVTLYNLIQMRFNPEIYGHIKEDKVAYYGKEVGLWLKANASPDAIIATNTAGSIPYFSKLKTIDMLGMNDVHIAHRQIPSLGKGWAGHEKGDGDYVLSRGPDYILMGSNLGSEYPVFLSDYEIFNNPDFQNQYIPEIHRLESGDRMFIYKRNQGGN